MLPVPASDISDWANLAQTTFGSELTTMIDSATPLPATPTAGNDLQTDISMR